MYFKLHLFFRNSEIYLAVYHRSSYFRLFLGYLSDGIILRTGSGISYNLFKRMKVEDYKKVEEEPKLDAKGVLPEAEVVGIQRKKYQIHVSGRDVPPPLLSFEQLRTQYRCKKYLMKNIAEAGYTEPTPIQRQAVSTLLAVISSPVSIWM